jgi:CheY-like chemotaxis protein
VKQASPLPRVLVVEDNPINVIVLKKFIEHVCEADSVTSGSKALELLADRPYALVLMDINLGNDDMTGLDVLGMLRKDERFRNLPVVAVTAHLGMADIAMYQQAGFDEFLSKPINRDDVLKVFAKYLPSPVH